ncbi:hypothetical protein C3Y87_00095 [Carbonactinospora thermoautotrophica]|uniref:hypothetical protein n=1 Tax=Carbonactinospora thermoautotrophica TaxID=1469144 RepID=UPI00226F1769|nr:hypothetical protein [Carbonactinospora thermoautotrophica]MCX9189843.1 hypothetical protein [Carbonactinospora thermoautotrophica]
MRSFRHRLPERVRAVLDLEPGERVLAAARADDGSYVVATDRALHRVPGVRIPWHDVDQARWDADTDTLHLLQDGEPRRAHRMRLERPGRLPETVRERVQSSIVISQRVRLSGKLGARIVGRRQPGREELLWRVLLDPGLDPDDPLVREAIEHALAELRAQT